MARNPGTVGYVTATVADSAGTLLGLSGGTKPALGLSFKGTLETANIRARGDGTSPTTSEGELYQNGQTFVMSDTEVAKTEFIRTTATSGGINGHWYNVEASVLLGTEG